MMRRMIGILAFMIIAFICLQVESVSGEIQQKYPNKVEVFDTTEKIHLDSHIEILIDKERIYTIEDIISGELDDKFFFYNQIGNPNFGYSNAAFWVRFQVNNESNKRDWLLEVDTPKINKISIFYPEENQNYQEKTIGNLKPFREREVNHRNLNFNLFIDEGQENTYYLRLTTGSSMQIPLTIWNPTVYYEKALIGYLMFGILIGVSVVMFLYNLFLFFVIRDRSYLYYILFVVLNAFLYLSDSGLAFQLLWPEAVTWNLRAVVVFMALGNASGLLFVRSFLYTGTFTPKLDKLYQFLIVCSVSFGIWGMFSVTLAMYAALVCVFITVLLVIPTAFMILKKGFRPARILALAWSIFLCGVLISILVEVGILPLSLISKYAWQVATVLEVVLLSLALGDKYKMINEEYEKAEAEVKWSQKRSLESLKKVDELKDEFLANTSHELRTPLNGIIGIAETLREGIAGKVSHEMHTQLGMIISSGRRLSHLVNDILDFSKLKNDDIVIQPEHVNIKELTDVVLTVCQFLIKDKPITLINQIKTRTPFVMADENRLQQILYNLIGNAIQYTESGVVKITAQTDLDYLKIHVADTGKGIPSSQLPSIFEPFQQGNRDMFHDGEGTGIGLHITKQLVELHHGTISVTSRVGHGSVFTFTLPISRHQQKHLIETNENKEIQLKKNQNIQIASGSIPFPNESDAQILIADDEQVNLQVLRNQLVLEGYKVIAVTNGEQVINMIQEKSFDLLILDIMMPKMSGYDVCRKLREHYSIHELPILMLTAKNQMNDKITAFEVGANDYLSKPCDKKELLSRVKTLIQLSQLHEQLAQINRHLEEKVSDRTNELRIANQHLSEANEDLRDMARSRRQFLENIAHELGTPVTLIHSYVQGVEEGFITMDHPRYLKMVTQKIHILDRLINDLSDLSNWEAGNMRLNRAFITVTDFITHMYKNIELDLIQGERSFTYFETNGLENDTTRICYIDLERMDQVFSNLIWNAIKHTSKEGGEIGVRLSIPQPRHELMIEIHDNGDGINTELIPYIFDRFYKAAASSLDDPVSTGLGLAIAKEIIQVHSGEIWASSKAGEGSSFFMTIPFRFQKEEGDVR